MKMNGSPTLRWAVIIVLSAATAGMVAVSIRANYLFGYGFGQSPERAQIFGWANVSADVWKVFGLILIGNLWQFGHKRLAGILFPIWVLCLLWGMIGAIGVYAQDRSALVGARNSLATAYADAEREIDEIERKLADLPTRTVAQVDAAIAAVFARPVRNGDRIRGTVGKISSNCEREDRATADACLEVARLREERAASEVAVRLGARAFELRALVSPLRDQGASLPPDPSAEFLSWLSGGQLRVQDIAFGFPLVFALLIELISAFGPAAVVSFAVGTRETGKGSRTWSEPAMAGRGEPRRAMASLGWPQRVAQWMAERTEPTSTDSAISCKLLYTDFLSWCARINIVGTDQNVFESELDHIREASEICGMIRKHGQNYFGIQLSGPDDFHRTRGR